MWKLTRWLLALVLVLCGCGVEAQSRPERITIANPPTTGQDAVPEGDGPSVTVFFVRGARLEPVLRAVPSPDIATALNALTAGPTRQEVFTGLRTALAPQTFAVTRDSPDDPTTSIDVPREFTSVAGGNQLLAVAQVVWAVTQFPDVKRVRITAEGKPLEVPTDDGLSDRAVGRDDFSSVAPSENPPPTPSSPPDAPSTGTEPSAGGVPATPSTTGG